MALKPLKIRSALYSRAQSTVRPLKAIVLQPGISLVALLICSILLSQEKVAFFDGFSKTANSVVSDVGGAVLVDAAEENYFISVINETSGSDGAVHIEVVTQANPV